LALAVAGTLLAGGLFTAWFTCRAVPFDIALAVLVVGLLAERWVYKPIDSEPPGAGWDRTGERFADPRTGRTVAVYHDSRTGQRRYVAD
jgi:hypothetical protein